MEEMEDVEDMAKIEVKDYMEGTVVMNTTEDTKVRELTLSLSWSSLCLCPNACPSFVFVFTFESVNGRRLFYIC